MTDLELAEEIERHLAPDAIYWHWEPSMADMEQIIAALRRGPEPVPDGFVRAVTDPLGRTMCTAQATGQWPFNERPPSGEMVMVPREDLIRWACWLEEADSHLGPYLLGSKRDASFKEAADEIRSRLAGTFSCPHCGKTTPHQHSIDRKGNAALSAVEAEGRKT